MTAVPSTKASPTATAASRNRARSSRPRQCSQPTAANPQPDAIANSQSALCGRTNQAAIPAAKATASQGPRSCPDRSRNASAASAKLDKPPGRCQGRCGATRAGGSASPSGTKGAVFVAMIRFGKEAVPDGKQYRGQRKCGGGCRPDRRG